MSDNDSNDCLSEFDDSVECFIDSGIQNTNLSTIPSNNDLDNHFDDSSNKYLNVLNPTKIIKKIPKIKIVTCFYYNSD